VDEAGNAALRELAKSRADGSGPAMTLQAPDTITRNMIHTFFIL
jgi:hypothetical protein